jgi:hypothetical protein
MATFTVMLLAYVHIPDNTRLINTYLEKYSVADVFREIHEEIQKKTFFLLLSAIGTDSYKIDFSSPIGDLRNAAWVENLTLHFPK